MVTAREDHMANPQTPVQRTADSPVREPGSSQGMNPSTPSDARAQSKKGEKLPDPGDSGLALPHERDQAVDMTNAQPDPQVKQADRDLRRGLEDTGKSRPMNTTYEKLKR
jgi:hypothetical protein